MNLNTITVLHVDDDSSFRDLVQMFLKRTDDTLTVISEPSAEAGLGRLDQDSIDCIVSDYDMPDIDGLEFLERVRDRGNDVPFILFTGKGSEEVASKAISAGVDEYLQKAGHSEQYELLANRIRTVAEKSNTEHHVQGVYEAIDHVTDGVSLIDENGRFIYVNRAYAQTFQYDPDELHGQHWATIYRNDEDLQYIKNEVLPTTVHDESWTGTTLHEQKDGTMIQTDHKLSYTCDGMMVCIVTDYAPIPDVDHDVPVLNDVE